MQYFTYINELYQKYEPLAVEGFSKYAVGGTIAFVFISLKNSIWNFVDSKWFSDIGKYEGTYHGYRWTGPLAEDMISPKVKIFKKHIFAGYSLLWTTPGNVEFRYPLTEKRSREIYAYGKSKEVGAYSFFVIHPAKSDQVELLSGIYLFLDSSHRIVSGNFLMSKKKLSIDQVKQIMPPSFACSTQKEANDRYQEYREMFNPAK